MSGIYRHKDKADGSSPPHDGAFRQLYNMGIEGEASIQVTSADEAGKRDDTDAYIDPNQETAGQHIKTTKWKPK